MLKDYEKMSLNYLHENNELIRINQLRVVVSQGDK